MHPPDSQSFRAINLGGLTMRLCDFDCLLEACNAI
jgi:hypothetical protein